MKSPAVDAYIAKSPEFARPILERIREAYHKASPDISEAMKWRMPFFEYHGILGRMAAFRKHADYGFWHAKLMTGSKEGIAGDGPPGMAGAKITDVSQLPPLKVLVAQVKEAMALNEAGVKRPPRRKATAVKIPSDLTAALKKRAKAASTFKEMSTSCRNEYVEWITDAKQEATRQKRLTTTIQWLEEGKSRNWKYESKRPAK